MTGLSLEGFVAEARRRADDCAESADCVDAIAPLMLELLQGDRGFLGPEHFRSDPDHYARNGIHISGDGRLSLFALVWNPGQWTPIHDHGTWGVVGIVRGVLEERAFIRTDGHDERDQGIQLARGGLALVAVDGTLVRVLTWYDNEWGFSNRMSDTAVAIGKLK